MNTAFNPVEEEHVLSETLQPAPIVRSSNAWVASCRTVNSMDVFSKHLLLYQPDLRNWCPRGQFCPYRDDVVHVAHYMHKPRPKDVSRTALANRPGAKSRQLPRIPHVSQAWEVTRKIVESKRRLEGIPTDRVVVLFCHGFSETYFRVIAYLNHLIGSSLFGNLAGQDPCLCCFTWPSQSVSYFRARYMAQKAAMKLRRVIQFLHNHGNKIILIGHSLGTRVVLHSLLDLKQELCIKHLFLFGSAVAADDLGPGKPFAADRIAAEKVTVCYSKRDATLRQGFALAEFIPGVWNMLPRTVLPLGLVGIRGKVDEKCESYDCTSEIEGHSVHFYFKSKTCIDLLGKSVAAQMTLPACL